MTKLARTGAGMALILGIATLPAAAATPGQDSTANCRESVASKLRDGNGTVCTPPPPADNPATRRTTGAAPVTQGQQRLTPSPTYLPDAPFIENMTARAPGASEPAAKLEGNPTYLPDAPFIQRVPAKGGQPDGGARGNPAEPKR